LEKTNVFKSAQQEWTNTWVPAILQYADSCSGKIAAAILQARKDYDGTYTLTVPIGSLLTALPSPIIK